MAQTFPNISDPSELKDYSVAELESLAALCRQEIMRTVSHTGGHLASNLGVVELTLALARTFDFGPERDRLIFDVGHQSYTWKLITGRSGEFYSLRQQGGLSGFPKRSESPYDFYDAGHSSTAASIALGCQRADRLNGVQRQNVVVLGDGALTGGMAFEALNDAGQSQDPIKVILNDNQMSIDHNVGALARHLEKIRISNSYLGLKKQVKNSLDNGSGAAARVKDFLTDFKQNLRLRLHKESIFFEALGFRYYGPVDGHNIPDLLASLRAVQLSDKPTILHVITKKGQGYSPAEEEPSRFHGVAPFFLDAKTQQSKQSNGRKTFSNYVSDFLVDAASRDEQVCAITAAMAQGTGLADFEIKFPERFFDTGITEQHAVSLGAGLSLAGKKVFVALYSTFSQRAVDQILHDVCLENLPVCFLLDRAGEVGADGETHQGLYDISIFSSFPNLQLFAPADGRDLELLIEEALKTNIPMMIRYPKAKTEYDLGINNRNLRTLRLMRPGREIAIIAYGVMADSALQAAEILEKNNHSVAVYSLITGNNIQVNDKIEELCSYQHVSIVEDGIRTGGVAENLALKLCEQGLKVPLLHTVQNGLRGQATREELLKEEGLDPEGIASTILASLN
ncbi:MAG: 1-deoxy-D-xylulose-5-phosphate synthase [Eubacteriales bacterium]|nr:1-deoxy-D-xylulose-5-phosphate synthase [Eubacteriales bacterium]